MHSFLPKGLLKTSIVLLLSIFVNFCKAQTHFFYGPEAFQKETFFVDTSIHYYDAYPRGLDSLTYWYRELACDLDYYDYDLIPEDSLIITEDSLLLIKPVTRGHVPGFFGYEKFIYQKNFFLTTVRDKNQPDFTIYEDDSLELKVVAHNVDCQYPCYTVIEQRDCYLQAYLYIRVKNKLMPPFLFKLHNITIMEDEGTYFSAIKNRTIYTLCWAEGSQMEHHPYIIRIPLSNLIKMAQAVD